MTFGPPEGTAPLAAEQVRPGEQTWRVVRDLVTYGSALEVVKDLGEVRFPDIDWSLRRRAEERYSWVGDDVTSARGDARWTMRVARGTWSAETRTATALTCTPRTFVLHATQDAYEGDRRVDARTWNVEVPRDHV
ncbi:hypothetical protein [Euzebya sp.]|uniref:hypothetical protein n=1 Tax=Euzebya sp. TaxID=1971409 RepID=UPI003512CA93